MTIEIREHREGDMPEVLALYGRTFGEAARAAWERRFLWQFFENPAAQGRPAKLYVARVNGDLAAFLAGLPVRLSIMGVEHAVLMPCDMMAAPEARGYNLGWRLTSKLAAECGDLAFSLAHSDAAAKLYDALDWRPVDLWPVALRPRNPGALVARAFRKVLGVRADATLARIIARCARRAGHVAGAAFDRATWPRIGRGWTVERVSHADDELDAMWRRLSGAFGVTGVRDRRFVEWRFVRDPGATHILMVARKASEIRGYAAVTTVVQRELVFGKVMDLFCDPTDPEAARALLRGALEALSELGADVCVRKGLHPGIRACLAPFFPLRARIPSRPARLLWMGAAALAHVVYDAASWHVTHADGDEDMRS
jgi:hypothetical protein